MVYEYFWSLPGPATFIERMRDEISMGRSIVVRLPSYGPADLDWALRRVISSAWEWVPIRARNEGSPVGQLLETLGINLTKSTPSAIEGLLGSERYRGTLTWIRGIQRTHWPHWRDFLAEHEIASRKYPAHDRAILIVELEGDLADETITEEVALACMSWSDVVGELDMLHYAAQALRSSEANPRRRSLLAFCVAKLAMWDRDTADRLLAARQDDIIAPAAILDEIRRDRGWRVDQAASWSAGSEGRFDGQLCRHSACCDIDRFGATQIDRRLWAAQAMVILPLIEERRMELIEKARRYIQFPVQTREGQIDKAEDLEIGTLHHLVFRTAADTRLKNRIDRIRRIRNKLAHLEPLEIALALHPDLYESIN